MDLAPFCRKERAVRLDDQLFQQLHTSPGQMRTVIRVCEKPGAHDRVDGYRKRNDSGVEADVSGRTCTVVFRVYN